jgi:hypothetical protein
VPDDTVRETCRVESYSHRWYTQLRVAE